MSARSTATSSSKRTAESRAAGATRTSRVTGVGLSTALGGLKEELLKPGKRPVLFAGAAFAAYMTLLFASIAVWWGLSNLMDQAWAALIVTAVWAIVSTVLYIASKRPASSRPS